MPDESDLLKIINDPKAIRSWKGIVMIEAIAILVLAALDQILKDGIAFRIRIPAYVLFLTILFCLWLRARNALPRKIDRTDKCVAIAVAIETGSGAEERILLNNEFVPQFKSLIAVKELSGHVEIVVCDEHQAVKVGVAIGEDTTHDLERARGTWKNVHYQIDADCYLWGKIYRFGDEFVLDFRTHVDLDFADEVNEEIQKQLEDLGRKKLVYEASEALHGVAVQARYFSYVARSVIALVTLYSDRLESSISLDRNLRNDLLVAPDFEEKDQLLKGCNRRLSLHAFFQAQDAMRNNNKALCEELLREAELLDASNPNIYMLRAANDFRWYRRILSAIANLNRAEELTPDGDIAIQYSRAFLLMAQDKFREALDIYEYILTDWHHQYEVVTVHQVIAFNKIVHSQSPNFHQADFIVGILTALKLKKHEEGIRHLDRFLGSVGKSKKWKILAHAAREYKRQFQKLPLYP